MASSGEATEIGHHHEHHKVGMLITTLPFDFFATSSLHTSCQIPFSWDINEIAFLNLKNLFKMLA